MKKYDYYESIKADVRDYIRGEINPAEYSDRDELEDCLNNDLWSVDSVTGNASGSYTFSAWQAEENLCHNLDLLRDALDDFGGDYGVLLENPEAADVTIRCHLLGACIAEVLDEYSDD